jgi:hypothetical protein
MHLNRVGGNPAARIAIGVCIGAALMLTGLVGSASAKDRNDDRIPDAWEKRYHLSLQVNQAKRDQDGDDLRNRAEFRGGTNPRKADSDGDGVADADEHAGTVSSFTPGTDPETGTLVIDLHAGGTLEGEITEDTRIICPPAAPDQTAMSGPRPPAGTSGPPEGAPSGPQGPAGAGEDPEHGCPQGEECSVEDLEPGRVVHEATVTVTANGNEFRTIVLAP